MGALPPARKPASMQLVTASLPRWLMYVPIGHTVQSTVLPASGMYLPLPQALQAASADCPRTSWYLPAAQLAQSDTSSLTSSGSDASQALHVPLGQSCNPKPKVALKAKGGTH